MNISIAAMLWMWWQLRWPLAVWLGLLLIAIVLVSIISIDKLREIRRQRDINIHPVDRAMTFTLDTDLQGTLLSQAWHRWKILNRCAIVLLAAALITSLLQVGRPAHIHDSLEQASSRDIVLCLDVSGSTLPYDRDVIQSYATIVNHFQGERIGLSIFNSTSRTVFPLTDDYELVKRQLTYAAKLLSNVQSQQTIDSMQQRQYQQIADWLEGTQNRTEATSLIGDGLVSCAAMLPGFLYSSRAHRHASIILATDNVVSGKPTYSLKEALTLTKQAGIRVEGLYSGAQHTQDQSHARQMRQLIEAQGGMFFTRQNDNSTLGLVRTIEQRYVPKAQQLQHSALSDDPGIFTLIVILCFTGWLITAWRLRR